MSSNKKETQSIFSIIFFTCVVLLFHMQPLKSANSEGAGNGTFMRALYIPGVKARNIGYMKSIIEKGKPLGVNMLVIDVQTGSDRYNVNAKVLDFLKGEKIYLAARIVCFQDGIPALPVSEKKLARLQELVALSVKSGFDEIQLDYIRFPDGSVYYPLKKKYAVIEELLKKFREMTAKSNVKLSADIFGRIVYNQNDLIGQKLEIFAGYTDVIYPMLYPSHYTGDRQRMSTPGDTVKEGTVKGLKRVEGKSVSIQPYIQAFPYNIQYAKVNLERYVALQITAVEETKARGWVAWNPNGDYSSVFGALRIAERK